MPYGSVKNCGKKIIFLFSGQGSQYYKMGKYLYENNSVFSNWMDRLDNIVSDVIGESICEKIYDTPKKIHDPFNRTLYSHPAIFMVEYSLAQLLLQDGIEPDGVLGVSLGEFAAATVGGALSMNDAIDAVIKQAMRIEENCEKGAMYAVLEDKSIYDKEPVLYENCELAAINYKTHFVISLKYDCTDLVEKFLNKNQIGYQQLPVSQAFHSSLLDPAKKSYKEVLKNMNCQKPNVLFYSSVYAGILRDIPKDYFWEIAREPILFEKTMQSIKDKDEYLYIDIGPSGTLSNFVKYNLGCRNTACIFPVITPFGNEMRNLQAIRDLCRDMQFLNEFV